MIHETIVFCTAHEKMHPWYSSATSYSEKIEVEYALESLWCDFSVNS